MHLTRLCLVIVAVRLVACGPAPGDPRADIQALLARAEQAAEAGDVEVLAATLHPDFVDDHGRDRRAMVFMLRSLMGRYARTEIVLRDIVSGTRSETVAFHVSTAGEKGYFW